MAINVNTVYQTVLLIINKEQRGYITPDEFNKTATQVQLDTFEQYFDDLNQQLRVPQADFDYSDRQMNIDENMSIFKAIGNCLPKLNNNVIVPGAFDLPTIDLNTGDGIVYNDNPSTNEVSFYRLGTIVFNPAAGDPVELQRLQRSDFYNIQSSPLTKSTKSFPTYLYENNTLFIRPIDITSSIEASFIRKPRNVIWDYGIGAQGQYIYSPSGSQDFELNSSEQVNVILKILQYSGIVIRDPQIIQAASAEVAQNEANSKS